jgi:hypothetical protein
VLTFDQLDAACTARGGYSGAQRTQIAAWQERNAVSGVRAHLPTLRRDAAIARQLDQSAATIVGMVRSKGANDCVAAESLTRLPDSQFGKLSLPEAAAAPATTPASAAKPATASAAPPTSPPANTAVPTALLASIDSIAFDDRPKMGFGGFIMLDIYPVVLFKSGEALTDVEGLQFAGGQTAHRAAHPDKWTRWRRAGGKIQLLKEQKWEELHYNTFERLPPDLRLAGLFRQTGGTGNLAVGGNQAVTVVDEYRFTADGSVTHSGAFGSQAGAGNTSVVTSGKKGDRRGRYRVDGLQLRIDYEDGGREQRILIADPKDPTGTIWLDGEPYVQRRNQ